MVRVRPPEPHLQNTALWYYFFMSEVMAHFEKKHAHLSPRYRDETGIYSDSPVLVALEMARLLEQEGQKPSLVAIRGEEIDKVGNREALVMRQCGGQRWGAHVVCIAEGLVYDPMLPEPQPVEDYLVRSFDQAVCLEDLSSLLQVS